MCISVGEDVGGGASAAWFEEPTFEQAALPSTSEVKHSAWFSLDFGIKMEILNMAIHRGAVYCLHMSVSHWWDDNLQVQCPV